MLWLFLRSWRFAPPLSYTSTTAEEQDLGTTRGAFTASFDPRSLPHLEEQFVTGSATGPISTSALYSATALRRYTPMRPSAAASRSDVS